MAIPCALCLAVSQSEGSNFPLYNTHLFSTPGFVILPALGPIVLGHVLVVTRDHITSLGQTGRSTIDEYEALVESVIRRPGYSRRDLLEAEHGSSDQESAGACITHAHVNLIPGLGSLVEVLDHELPRLPIEPSPAGLLFPPPPYIFMRAADHVRLFRAHDVGSQRIRRAIFERLSRDDWDWAVFPHLDVVAATVELWRRIV
jgi:diadenosine tetraphosphate (Ap4A) HIT family hydrolase